MEHIRDAWEGGLVLWQESAPKGKNQFNNLPGPEGMMLPNWVISLLSPYLTSFSVTPTFNPWMERKTTVGEWGKASCGRTDSRETHCPHTAFPLPLSVLAG